MTRRIRWAVRGTLFLGVAASITANVLHARDNPISQAIAAWPPLALLITVEVVARVPITRRWFAVVRVLATALIAGIAAWVSYWHMAGVAQRYGEQGSAPFLLPLSVDGLIVVASVCLVELGGRDRAAEESTQGGSDGNQLGEDRPRSERGDHLGGSEGSVGAGEGDGPQRRRAAGGDPAPVGEGAAGQVAEESTRGGSSGEEHREGAGGRGGGVRGEHGEEQSDAPGDAADRTGAGTESRADEVAADPAQIEPPKPAARKPHTTNPDRVRRAYARNPEADPKAVAKQLKLSPATVKRYRPPREQPEQVNGKVPDLALEGAK